MTTQLSAHSYVLFGNGYVVVKSQLRAINSTLETTMSRCTVVLILAIALTQPLSAQRLERSHIAVRSPDAAEMVPGVPPSVVALASRDSAHPVGPMLLSGLMLGAAGMFAGGYLGYAAETSGCGDDDFFCGLGGAILGGLIGESLGVAGGIHLAGRKGHSFAGDVAIALGIGALGLVAAPMTSGVSLLAIPVAQLAVGTRREAKSHP